MVFVACVSASPFVATKNLKPSQAEVKQMKFPDRSSKTGKMIDAYLADGDALDDHAIHLLFSANRWECRCELRCEASQCAVLMQ